MKSTLNIGNHITRSAAMAILLITIYCNSNSHAQTYTQWQQGAASDYYLNIDWSCNTNTGCYCYYQNDVVEYYLAGGPDYYMGQESFAHANTQSGPTVLELGPSRTHNVFAEMSVYGGQNNGAGGCLPFGCETLGSSASIVMSTTLPRRPELQTPTYLSNGGIEFQWSNTTDIPNSKYEIHVYQNGSLITTLPGGTTSWTLNSCVDAGEAWFFYTVYNGETSGATYTSTSPHYVYQVPNPRPLPPAPPGGYGSISGKIETISGNGVGGVTVKATLLNAGSYNGGCWPAEYTSLPSQQTGTFNISGIYFNPNGPAAEYKIEAFLDGHSFRYDNASNTDSTVTLSISSAPNNSFSNIDFIDITSYVISGTVTTLEGGCGLPNVTIKEFPPGNSGVIPVTTESDGTYSLVVPEGNRSYEIYAQYDFGKIADSVMTVSVVEDDISGINYILNSVDTIRGFIGAGCLEYIGQAQIEVRTEGGCLLKTIAASNNGFYEMTLPSIPVELEIVDITDLQPGLDYNTVLDSINDIRYVDLDSTTTLDIIYRKPISIEIEGMPGPPCPSVAQPVVNQDQVYPITIKVWESVGVCPADTGYIAIANDIGTYSTESTLQDTIPIVNGVAQYYLRPGDPTLVAPYYKYISYTAHVDGEVITMTDTAIVSGSRLRTSTVISTPSDSLPLMILRDPPGDESFSHFSQNNSTTYAQSFSHEVGGSARLWAKAKGIAPIFAIKLWGEIAGSIEAGGSRLSSTETEVTLTTTQEISTSDGSSFIGTDGDLIMGAAINFKYGLSDDRIFDINTCSMIIDTSLIFSPDSFSTTFIHSTKFIKSSILPSLEVIANNPNTTEEARRKFRNKIKVWEQMLQLNEELKEQALAEATSNGSVENYTIDAGASFSSSITGSSTKTASLEFTTFIDAAIAASAGIEIENLFEGELGVEVKIRSDWGQSTTQSTTEETTTGFTFADGDAGDFLSFSYTIDSVYGTPVFGDVIGATSCPHEPETQIIDLATFTVANPVYVAGPGEDFHEFDFTIVNISEPTESTPRDFLLSLIPASNPDGAIVTINGLTPIDVQFYGIQEGVPVTGKIRVTKPAGSQFSFEGLQFDLVPACLASGNPFPELGEAKSVFLSVFFQSNCSNIAMASPQEGWLVNTSDINLIPVTMDGYNLGGDPISEVRLMYRSGSPTWQPTNIVIPGGNLVAPPQTYMWDVSDLPDGDYLIRWELDCGSTTNYSLRKGGIIDRSFPTVFGVEKPINDLYDPGKEISVQFSEELNFSNMNNTNVYLKALPQQILYPVQFIGDGDGILIIPDSSINQLYNQEFEVGIIAVEDLNGNVRDDTVTWQFVVDEPDSDGDGNPDTKDFCWGGDDFVDSDLDGLPDDCDCLPNDHSNGRLVTKTSLDFDGNELVSIPNNPDLIPTTSNEVTMEVWLNPRDTASDYVDVIAASAGNLYLARTYFGLQLLTNQYSVQNIYLNPFEWTHLAVIFTTTGAKIYINGELSVDYPLTHHTTNAGNPLSIGGNIGEPLYRMDGQMDEFRIWDHARTQYEIQSLMNEELTGTESGLALYYDLNDGTPNGNNTDIVYVQDKTQNGINGTLVNFTKTGLTSNFVKNTFNSAVAVYATCTSPCPDFDQAGLHFDGVNDYATISNHTDIAPTSSKSITFEAWLYPEGISFNNFSTFVGQLDSPNGAILYQASIFQSGSIIITNPGASFAFSNATLPLNTWSHVALVFGGSTVKIYINGQFDSAHNASYPASSNGFSDIRLSHPIAAQNFIGIMDDVRFWNHERSAAEILANYETELLGSESGLGAYFNFNQGVPGGNNMSLDSIVDLSGNALHATPINFEKTGNVSNWVNSVISAKDEDKDGTPDFCDACIAPEKLLLQNTMITSGDYRAKNQIILGENLTTDVGAIVNLFTPKVVVRNNGTKQLNGGIYTINPIPCPN